MVIYQDTKGEIIMGPINGINPNKVTYFDLEEYVRRIKIEDYVLEHMQESNTMFDEYLRKLCQYDDYSIIHYLIDSLSKEIASSYAIEKHYIKPSDILANNVFFDTLQMNHSRVKKLHEFIMGKDEDYREDDVKVSAIMKDGSEVIYWHAPVHEDVKRFMDDFIRIYKTTSLSIIHSNPFLKAALVHLLFVRIHPFLDGNGRTARMVHNIKFTDSINKIHNMKLKICPLNLSSSILINQFEYVKRLDSIYFDLEHDCNDEINKWFNYMLKMVDEQVYYGLSRIDELNDSLKNMAALKDTDSSGIISLVKKMDIKKQ